MSLATRWLPRSADSTQSASFVSLCTHLGRLFRGSHSSILQENSLTFNYATPPSKTGISLLSSVPEISRRSPASGRSFTMRCVGKLKTLGAISHRVAERCPRIIQSKMTSRSITSGSLKKLVFQKYTWDREPSRSATHVVCMYECRRVPVRADPRRQIGGGQANLTTNSKRTTRSL